MIVDLLLKRKATPGTRGYVYDVFSGRTLIVSSRDPEYAACRHLAEDGFTGTARFWREGKSCHDSSLDIQRAAKWRTTEGNRDGLRVVRYQEHWARETQEF